MNKLCKVSRERGVTRVELLIALALSAVLLIVYLPRFARAHSHSPKMRCVLNLKGVGIAFRVWANDNDDHFPQQVAESEGGAKESVLAGNLVQLFRVMSNEFAVPRAVICPADDREYVTNWSQLSSSNISYLIGSEADRSRGDMILSGDRDIVEKGKLLSGTVNLITNRPVAWHKALHEYGGNVGLADGSVQQLNDSTLKKILTKTGDARNTVLFPQ